MKELPDLPESLESDIDDNITDDDFGFVLDRHGNLKSVFLPENLDDIPDKVMDILELFDIDSIDSLRDPTVTVH